MKYLLFLFSIVFFSARIFAQGEVIITESNQYEPFDLSENLFYLIDENDELTFNQITHPSYSNKFFQSDKSSFFYNAESPSQWYKLSVFNTTTEIQKLVLSVDNPLVADISFFSTADSGFSFSTGIYRPWNERLFSFKNFLFPIQIAPNERVTYAIKINKQEFPSYIPISLIPEKIVQSKLRTYAFYFGIFLCVLMFFALMLFILWRYEKNTSLSILLLLFISLVFHYLWRESVFLHYLFSNSPQLNLSFGKLLILVEILLLALFVKLQFASNKENRRLESLFTVLFIAGSLFTILQFILPDFKFFLIGNLLLLLFVFVLTVLSIKADKESRNFYYHNIVLLVAVLMVDLVFRLFFKQNIKGIGFIDIQLSSFFIFACFLLVISVFFSRFNKSKNEIDAMKINLEHLVEKRTFQLNTQKEELKTQHEELIIQKETLQSQREELRAQKELLEIKNQELAKLSLVASKTDNLIYIFTPNGELDWFNSSYSLILGLTVEEYKRGNSLNIIDISTNSNIRHVLNTCIREKSVVSYESIMLDEHKNTKWYHTTITPILDDNEQLTYLIAIDTDITRLKQFEDELERHSKDAEHQKNLAIKRKEELEERQIEVYDSIRYAKRIQTAIMPKVKQIQRDFQDSFVLFLPKDIVSGDFYWYHRIGNKYFMAAVDCTGHGVPGAFMSIIGNYLLNSIVIHNQVDDPAEILKQLNRKIKIALKADNRSQTADGMDIALVVIDKSENTLSFASALRPMYLFSNDSFTEVKGDKNPITSSISGTSITSFSNQKFDFVEGDTFYIFSDGIIDQFGGETGKKYLTKRFKQLLFEINPLPMKEQKEIIKKSFDDWRGDYEQVDDILVMGIRYNDEPRF